MLLLLCCPYLNLQTDAGGGNVLLLDEVAGDATGAKDGCERELQQLRDILAADKELADIAVDQLKVQRQDGEEKEQMLDDIKQQLLQVRCLLLQAISTHSTTQNILGGDQQWLY